MRDRERQGGRTLLEIALDVRMSANGSMERSDEDQTSDMNLLQHALDTWEPSLPRYEKFDNAVRQLILAALKEQYSS